MTETTGFVAVLIILGVFLAIGVIGIIDYVLKSYSLYTLASRRQIPSPVLAWIPIASYWTLGSLADDYDQVKGFKRKWRVLLLLLSIFAICLYFAAYISLFVFVFALGIESGTGASEPEISEVLIPFITIYIFLLIAVLAIFLLNSLSTICYYKIFESTVPEKAVLYLCLTLTVPLAAGICLLKCKDKGYYKLSPVQEMMLKKAAAKEEAANEDVAADTELPNDSATEQ